MKTEDTGGAGFFFLSVAFVVAVLGFAAIAYNLGMRDGYKAACEDCYKGALKMELVSEPGGEVRWKKRQ